MSFVQDQIAEIKKTVGNKKVLCALSGGVDSSVCAALVSKAIGRNLTCIFVDHGLMRKNEAQTVEAIFTKYFDLNFIRIDAQERFLDKLKGVTDPEQKRKIIGAEFIAVFEEEAAKLGQIEFLLQGTIYPDIAESGDKSGKGLVKSHHNVGGLPENMNMQLLEPLKTLYKEEVRAAGRALGMPDVIVDRQPFPGPGLAVRIIGEITCEKLEILREADAIFCEELEAAGCGTRIWQYFALLPGVKSTGVCGGRRIYEYVIALRAVHTTDALTADFARIDYELLSKVSARIVSEVKGAGRVVYDITTKPPATIEWE